MKTSRSAQGWTELEASGSVIRGDPHENGLITSMIVLLFVLSNLSGTVAG